MSTEISEKELEAMFDSLEADKAALYNLPDSEFSEAYLSFRRKTETTIQTYIKNQFDLPLAVPNNTSTAYSSSLVVLGTALVWTGRKIAQVTPDTIKNRFNVMVNTLFGGSEGIPNFSRDPTTYTLDPAPYKQMMAMIMSKSKPNSEFIDTGTSYVQDLSRLKRFVEDSIPIIAAFGVSEAGAMLSVLRGLTNMMDSIYPTVETNSIKKYFSDETIEVKKTGAVIIASYQYNFVGEINKYCWWDYSKIDLNIHVRDWKFDTMGDLKQEYLRIDI